MTYKWFVQIYEAIIINIFILNHWSHHGDLDRQTACTLLLSFKKVRRGSEKIMPDPNTPNMVRYMQSRIWKGFSTRP